MSKKNVNNYSEEIKKENNNNKDNNNKIKDIDIDKVNKNKIEDKEEKLKKKKAEDYVTSSYNSFLYHIKDGNNALQKDIKNCKKMSIHSCSRDFIWFFFLGILNYNQNTNWKKIITDERSSYLELKKKYITKDIEDFIGTKKIKDKYALYFRFKDILPKEDYNILDLIKIDVNRTFQKIELFHLDKIQIMLINVLFVFAKENKDLGYRQGMSELCAVFLHVLYKEQVLKPAFIKDNDAFLYYLFHSNNEFLEHDTYLMFNKFMLKGFINFFRYSDEIYSESFLSLLSSEQKQTLTKKQIIDSNDSEIKKRIFLLYYDTFPQIDKSLYKFMVEKVDPEIFIFRWYLCIFTREFPVDKVVHLWDLILLVQFIEEKRREENKNNKKIDIKKYLKYKKNKNKSNNKINDDNINDNKNENIITDDNDDENENEIKNEINIKNYYSNDVNNSNHIKINNINCINDNINFDNNEKNIDNNNIIINNKIMKKKDIDIITNYNFIDCIALSMILKLKNTITKKKTSSQIISFLMKYPQDIDLKEIGQKALEIYNKINCKNKI